jgi:purine-binding chemotaxis protein CheW
MSAATRQLVAQSRWLAFTVECQRCALAVESVLRVVRAAQITSLPLAPEVVAGVIDIAGRTLAVFDLRRRLRMPARPLAISDQFILARTRRRDVVLIVDEVLGLVDAPGPDIVSAATLAPGLSHLAGVLSLPDGLVLIQDLDGFLSIDEELGLQAALRHEEARRAS